MPWDGKVDDRLRIGPVGREGGGWRDFPFWNLWVPKNLKQKLRFAGRDVHIFCVFLLMLFFFSKVFVFNFRTELRTSRNIEDQKCPFFLGRVD